MISTVPEERDFTNVKVIDRACSGFSCLSCELFKPMALQENILVSSAKLLCRHGNNVLVDNILYIDKISNLICILLLSLLHYLTKNK